MSLKKFVKRLLKNPLVEVAAPVAANMFLPGVGGAVANTLLGAASSSAHGGSPMLGALSGVGQHVLGGGNFAPGGAGASTISNLIDRIPEEGGTLSSYAPAMREYAETLERPVGRLGVSVAMGGLRGADATHRAMRRHEEELAARSRGEHRPGGQRAAPIDLERYIMLPDIDYFTYGESSGQNQFFGNNQMPRFQEGGGVRGVGSGRDDKINALVSNGEYVIDAESVALLGDGATEEGIRRLDEMRKRLRQHKGQALAKGKFTPASKAPEEYMPRVRKKKGGAVRHVKPLLELADKFERALSQGDARAAAKLAVEMDGIRPGSSRRARAAFSRGGKVADAIGKLLGVPKEGTVTTAERLRNLRQSVESELASDDMIAAELARVDPGNRWAEIFQQGQRAGEESLDEAALLKILEGE